MVAEINPLRKANESLGGVFEVRAFGLRARPRVARVLGGAARRPPRQAILSIQAMKAAAIGDGLEVAGLPGSQAHDEIFRDDRARLLSRRRTARAGWKAG